MNKNQTILKVTKIRIDQILVNRQVEATFKISTPKPTQEELLKLAEGTYVTFMPFTNSFTNSLTGEIYLSYKLIINDGI